MVWGICFVCIQFVLFIRLLNPPAKKRDLCLSTASGKICSMIFPGPELNSCFCPFQGGAMFPLFPVTRGFTWQPWLFKYRAEWLGNSISSFPQDFEVFLPTDFYILSSSGGAEADLHWQQEGLLPSLPCGPSTQEAQGEAVSEGTEVLAQTSLPPLLCARVAHGAGVGAFLDFPFLSNTAAEVLPVTLCFPWKLMSILFSSEDPYPHSLCLCTSSLPSFCPAGLSPAMLATCLPAQFLTPVHRGLWHSGKSP